MDYIVRNEMYASMYLSEEVAFDKFDEWSRYSECVELVRVRQDGTEEIILQSDRLA